MQNNKGKSLCVQHLCVFYLKLRSVPSKRFWSLVSAHSFQNIIFVLSCVYLQSCFPLLFWLIHLQQGPERRHAIVLLLHIKGKRAQTGIK